MREVAVVGVGMTKFGKLERTNVEMFAEAAIEAIRDAKNLEAKDTEALYIGNFSSDFEEAQTNFAGFCAAQIGCPNIPATKIEGACASSGVAFRMAYLAVAGGFNDMVMAAGTERATIMGTPLGTKVFATASDSRYESPAGFTFPGVFAMMANKYAKKYEVPMEKLKERMAMIAVKNHANAMHNPKAHFQKETKVENALKSPMVADPLQLMDCCPFSDGAAAAILVPAEKAKQFTDTPVYVAGCGQSSAPPLVYQKDISRTISREIASKMAYEQAGIGPKDIDVVELHDCFTIAEIVASECLGLFEHGKGHLAVEEGETQIGGRIPINPSGGLKAKGHPVGATGVAQVVEIVEQLRGECGKRQVQGAEIGMTDTLGGDYATLSVNILRRKNRGTRWNIN